MDDEIIFCSTCKEPILIGEIVCRECAKKLQPVFSQEEVEAFAKSLNESRERRFAEFDNEKV